MIISRTPFRISFVGGGTDLKSFYAERDGQVLSTTIDKFVYVCVKKQMDIVEHKYRIIWSQAEFRDSIDSISHPIVREALRLLKIDYPIEITTFADVPANTGLGSSSSFAVGLLHALYALEGKHASKELLARIAAEIEIDILGRHIGKQDHYAAAFGNFNTITFKASENVCVDPVYYKPRLRNAICDRLMLFYTALRRDASDVLKEQRDRTVEKLPVLTQMRDLVEPLRETLEGTKPIADFGRILHDGWELKRSLTGQISSPEIDTYYNAARAAGALGGKLLGAGGGGFLLFYVEPDKQEAVKSALKGLFHMPFKFDDGGTRITYYDER